MCLESVKDIWFGSFCEMMAAIRGDKMKESQIRIGYIGRSEKIIKELLGSKNFNLSMVLWEGVKEIDPSLCDTLGAQGITVHAVGELEEIVRLINDSECKRFIMYQCRFILPLEILEKAEVFNIHPGSLQTNRGANPIVWTVLLREPATCMTLHRVNEKIDQGILIKESWVNVTPNDDCNSLESKMEERISDLLNALELHIKGELPGTEIAPGQYRRRLQEKDYTIQEDDSIEVISAKIRSQVKYRGAVLIVGDKKLYVTGVQAIL